jgi:outer membrane protein assembly complex protein YaeT
MKPGLRFASPALAFEGLQSLSPETVANFFKKADLTTPAFTDPKSVTSALEEYLARQGFLRARVSPPEIALQAGGGEARITFPLNEGRRFTVAGIRFLGNRFFDEIRLGKEVEIREGETFSPERYDRAASKIRQLYLGKGFKEVRVRPALEVLEEAGKVSLEFDIDERQQAVVEAIRLEGNRMTRENVILRALALKRGDVITAHLINKSRRELYELGLFGSVQIKTVPLENADRAGGQAQQEGEAAAARKPYSVTLVVTELKPYRLRYGLQYDTEAGPGVSGEITNRNLSGRSHLVGTGIRLSGDERDIRAFFRSRYFLGRRVDTEVFAFANRVVEPAFTVERIGLTLQQQRKLKKHLITSYHYTFERNHTFDEPVGGAPTLDTTENVARITGDISRDTRDKMLNASRGMFLSHSVGTALKALGSEAEFIRYYGQFFYYRKLSGSLIYASAVRLGLGKGIGGDLIPSERFFAGGGTTIRGFPLDGVGPKDPGTGTPLGGNAVFILNQEIRFPVAGPFSGVGFLDLGNVYPSVSDFDPFEVRKAAGVGVRFHAASLLLRLDWGFKLDRRPGESRSRIFFSMGQSF